jgi:predicted ATPase
VNLITLGELRLAGTGFTRAKPLLLLSYVALEGTRDRRHLAELFWPGAADPLNSLAAALKQLRRGAPGALEADKLRVWTPVPCDAGAFLGAVEAGRDDEAWAGYRGPFLSGVYLPDWSTELEEWVYATREFLAGRARTALLRLAEAGAAGGNFQEATKRAEAAYSLPGAPELEPEEVARLHALLTAGNSPHLGRLRRDAQDFGIDLRLSAAAAREGLQRAERPAATGVPRQQLPVRGTSFVGRDAELAQIATQLGKPECALLTLTGPGGVGKTRLALRAAHDLAQHYPDGVYFVPLVTLDDAGLLVPSIATEIGLGLQGGEDPFVQLVRHLGDKAALLVLDNYEHLLEGATLVSQLLGACPNLNLLVTSRERLDLEEEWVLPLSGFALPPGAGEPADAAEHDALRLFEDRAKRAQLSFELTPAERPYVASICNQVGGLPLGIELAAAWVKLLSCREIAWELGRSADLLTSTGRNVPERHRSIRAVFEHSWRLLTPRQQEVFRKLSVFQGGFRREAAAAVAGATIPVLASLIDKSLLRVTADGRYDRHPLLYAYAREKLAEAREEADATRERYVGYFLAYVEEAEGELHGERQAAWLERLVAEQANLRETLQLTRADPETHLRLAGALSGFWWQRGELGEGAAWLEGALASAGEQTAARAKALNGAGLIAWAQSLYPRARRHQEENLAIRRALADPDGVAVALNNLGIIAHDECRYGQAEAIHTEALAIWRELASQRGVALSLTNLGLAAYGQGEYLVAVARHAESLELMRELKNDYGIALALLNLGDARCALGDAAAAKPLLGESAARFVRLGNQRGVAFALESLAGVAVAQREAERAARLWGAAEAVRDAFGMPLPPSQRAAYERDLARARSQLDEAVFAAAWSEGRELEPKQAVADVVGQGGAWELWSEPSEGGAPAAAPAAEL